MDADRARTLNWLSLLGIPIAWVASFLVGTLGGSLAGLDSGSRAPMWFAILVVVAIAILFGIAALVAHWAGRRAETAGVPHAMLPTWIVIGMGILTVVQNLAAYFFA